MTPAELKHIRIQIGKRAAFAVLIGVMPRTIAQWEQGRRTIPEWMPKFLEIYHKNLSLKAKFKQQQVAVNLYKLDSYLSIGPDLTRGMITMITEDDV